MSIRIAVYTHCQMNENPCSNQEIHVLFEHGSELENILTSTKKASLIITDFLAVIKENEQRRTSSLCRGWAMFENDFNLICRRRAIPMTSYRLNVHMTALCIDRL